MKSVYTNWCQGTKRALMSKATMWNSRQRYVPKLVYSVSVLLLLRISWYAETFFSHWMAIVTSKDQYFYMSDILGRTFLFRLTVIDMS